MPTWFPSVDIDVWAILSGAPSEVPTLLAKLKAGEVDGSCYEGTCACLVGTLANARGVNYNDLCGIVPNSSRLAEVWFTNISVGDTPETSQSCKLAAEWVGGLADAPAGGVRSSRSYDAVRLSQRTSPSCVCAHKLVLQ